MTDRQIQFQTITRIGDNMQKVTVRKTDLEIRLEHNRGLHEQEYEEAIVGYRTKALELLKERTKEIENGGKVDLTFFLPRPEDHTEDYDRVLSMLQMSVNTEIDLTVQEFSNYVMDDWGWKANFTATTNLYKG